VIDAADLTTAASDGAQSIPIAAPMPLERVAEAYDRVDEGTRERLLLTIPNSSQSAADLRVRLRHRAALTA
jgi:hypothetical protein